MDKKQLQIAKQKVIKIFNRYKDNIDIIKEDVIQSVTTNYQASVVQTSGRNENRAENQIDVQVTADKYNKSVEDILRSLPSTFRKIIINRYIRRLEHEVIIAKLAIDDDYCIAESTYYVWLNKSIMAFYNEAMAIMIEKKIK